MGGILNRKRKVTLVHLLSTIYPWGSVCVVGWLAGVLIVMERIRDGTGEGVYFTAQTIIVLYTNCNCRAEQRYYPYG